MYQYRAHGLAPLTLLTKGNRKFPLQKELMFPGADVFPIQLVLMKPALSGHWRRNNRQEEADDMKESGVGPQVFVSGGKRRGRSQCVSG